MKNLIKAVQASDDFDVFEAPVAEFDRRVKAIKITSVANEGSTALTVTTARGVTKSTGELGLHVLEPIAGIQAITALGAGVTEFRVYYE